jgi:hypothetical protein
MMLIDTIKRSKLLFGFVTLSILCCATALAKSDKPNILVIWGDDIGMWNVGAYTHGMMGKTPNIDSIAKQGAIFTDHYAQASCSGSSSALRW